MQRTGAPSWWAWCSHFLWWCNCWTMLRQSLRSGPQNLWTLKFLRFLDVISLVVKVLEANLWFLLSKDVYKYGRLAGCTSFWSVVGQMSCKWYSLCIVEHWCWFNARCLHQYLVCRCLSSPMPWAACNLTILFVWSARCCGTLSRFLCPFGGWSMQQMQLGESNLWADLKPSSTIWHSLLN